VLVLNAYFSISNPFKRPENKNMLYHIGVWSTSIASGLIVAFNRQYRADFQLCWIAEVLASFPFSL
jgi:hypothetical protein